jgi:hypothetical protein
VLATLILSAAQILFGIKTHTNDEITILNNIQYLEIASGSWLQSRSQTYAYAYAKLRHYGVVYGTYGSRWPEDLQPLTTLVKSGQVEYCHCGSSAAISTYASDANACRCSCKMHAQAMCIPTLAEKRGYRVHSNSCIQRSNTCTGVCSTHAVAHIVAHMLSGGTLNTWRSGDDGWAVTARSLVRF